MSEAAGKRWNGSIVRINTVASYVTIFSVIYMSAQLRFSIFFGLTTILAIATSASTSSDPMGP